MSSTTDLRAEQEVTRQLHEWNKSAFGGLFDHLQKRCSLEQTYLDGLRSLLYDGERRTPCSLKSVDRVWQCDLKLLKEEVDIREQRLVIIEKSYRDLRTQEFLRQRSSEAHYNSLEENIRRYEDSRRTAQTAFSNLPLVPPAPKRGWGLRPTTGTTEDEVDRHDAVVRRCLYDLNNARLKVATRFRECLGEEKSTAEQVKVLFNRIASLTQDVAQHLNTFGNNLVNEVAKINTHSDSIPRQEWFENHISTVWISPIVYHNIRYNEPCRYMIFGLPFVSADEKVPVYQSNPRPYEVARVLIASARRANAPPTLHGVRPSPEILHRIEHGWDKSWETLPHHYLFPDLDLFRLLAHFFSSLPRPFIELDSELRAEITRLFSRWTQEPDLGTLGKVFGKAIRSDEKKLLVRLCKLLERNPAECSRIFVRPLFRTEGQDLEFMLFALIHSWRTFYSPSTPRSLQRSLSSPLETPDSYTDPYRGQDYSHLPSIMSSPAEETVAGASTWPQSPVHARHQRYSHDEAGDVQLQPTRHLRN